MQSLSTISEKLQIALMPIHCLSEQQLLQYVEQRMPEVELHLVEQHLVDCPLCSAAVEMLQHSDDKRPALQSIALNVRKYLQARYFPAPTESPAATDLQKARLLTRERKRETLSKYVWGLVFIGTAFGGVLWLNSHTEMPPRVAAAPGHPLSASPDKAALELTNGVPASFISSNEHKLVRQTVYTTQTQVPEKAMEPSKNIPGATNLAEPVSLLNDSTVKNHLPEHGETVPRSIAVPDGGLNNKKKNDTVRHSTPVPSESLQQRQPLSTLLQDKEKKKEDAVALRPEPAGEITGSSASGGGDELRYTTAKKLMQQGDWDEALNRLKDLSEEPGNRFYEMARYQSALCYKALGKKGKSRKMLKALIHENGPVKEQAAQQLSSL